MYPHERSLVKRLAGQPFALLGINSDTDREMLKKVMQQEQITWRSWWDSGQIHGPITTSWYINQRPAIYVLDAGGVIRYKDVKGEELDKAVDSLVHELATSGG